VLCQGRITRTKDSQDKKDLKEKAEIAKLAASILDYKFLHQS
jgi:hypothetical protein